VVENRGNIGLDFAGGVEVGDRVVLSVEGAVGNL
jgi:hypothetical protein